MKDALYNFIANLLNRRLVILTSPQTDKSVKVIVMRHFPCELPAVFDNTAVFQPLHCGAEISAMRLPGLRDDAGDNISKYNPFLNEMTGIYWMARHLGEMGLPDFIGTDHYRRFLQWTPDMLHPNTIVASSLLFHRSVGARVAFELNPENRNRALAKLTTWLAGNGYADFSRYLDGHVMYVGNMFVMPRDIFLRYFAFIEPCIRFFISLIDSDEIPLCDASSKEKRLYGYLLEHLTSYWIWREKETHRSHVITTCIQQYSITCNNSMLHMISRKSVLS